MASRVVHCRVQEHEIIGLYELLKAHNVRVEGKSVATLVSLGIGAFINGLRHDGVIREISPDEVRDRYDELFRDSSITASISEGNIHRAVRQAELESRNTGQLSKEELRARVEAYAGGSREVDLTTTSGELFTEDGEEDEELKESLEGKPCPWEGVTAIPFEVLKKAAPKDRWIEEYVALDGEKELAAHAKRAMEVAYAAVGRDDWGTDAVRTILVELAEEYKAWTEANKEDETNV